MKKTLHFSISIQSPRSVVWETMLSPEGYRAWTAAFMEGCYFSGSWEQGKKIQFLAPDGDGSSGMTAVIVENRPYAFISIQHLGEVNKGVEDTSSAKVLAWAPAYENYSFAEIGGGTEVKVSLDTLCEHEAYMNEAFPNALALLKSLCERKSIRAV